MPTTAIAEPSSDIANMDDALAALGATADLLSADERRSLDELGYVVFRDLIDPAWLSELRETYDAVLAREGRNAGHDYQQEEGAIRLGNLANKGDCFVRIVTHPKYLAAVRHIIPGEFLLDSISSREPIPHWDGPTQRFHADAPMGDRRLDRAVDSAWMLDDFTRASGATRVIPRSHRWPKRPGDALADPSAPHPDEIVIEAPAGSVLVFNGEIWHSGSKNHTDRRRRAIFPYMLDRAVSDGGAYQRLHLLKSTYDRLSPAARYLLAVDAEQRRG